MRPTLRGWSHFLWGCLILIEVREGVLRYMQQRRCVKYKALKNTHLGEDDLQPKWVILFMLRSDAARTTRTGQS